MDSSNMKIAYVIAVRNGKKFWNRCGVAFVNKDGSINLKLEAVPVSGEVHIRDYVAKDDLASSHRASNGNGHLEEDALAELA